MMREGDSLMKFLQRLVFSADSPIEPGQRSALPAWRVILPLLALLPMALLSVERASATTEVRVNQTGYATNGPKRAYLMATTSVTGAQFKVVDQNGKTIFGPTAIGASLGTWAKFHVFALDFDAFCNTGLFKISVTGPVSSTSHTFRVDTGANLYAGPLAHKLFFYQTERDGPNFIPNALRTAAGHLNDAQAKVFLTPTFDSNDNLVGDLTPNGVTIDASG